MLACAILTSCAPAEDDLNGRSTQIAASIFATQTAEAPTRMPTAAPTSTATLSYTQTPSPAELPTLTSTSTPSRTRSPTATPADTPTQLPTSTVTPKPSATATERPIGVETLSFDVPARINDIVWSPDGHSVAVATWSGLYVFDTIVGFEKFHAATETTIFSVVWQSDRHIFSAGFGLLITDLQNNETTALDVGLLWDIAASPDGTYMAYSHGPPEGGYFSHMQLPAGLSLLLTAEPIGEGTSLEISGQDTSRVVDVNELSSGNQITFQGHGPGNEVFAMSWSPDSTFLATAGGDEIIIWNIAQNSEVIRLSGYTGFTGPRYIAAVAWSPKGDYIVSGGSGLTLWDVEDGEIVQEFEGHSKYVSSVAWSPDGTRFASASQDGTTLIWEAETGTRLGTLAKSRGRIWSVSWSPDGSQIAAGAGDKVLIWTLQE